MERAKPSSIKRATALRYMGASGWQPDDATTALLDRAEEKILAAATPRAAVRRLPPGSVSTAGTGLRHRFNAPPARL